MSESPNYKEVVFVFASNKAGIHGSGSALHARLYKGAKQTNGFGRQGLSYAIPTKDWDINVTLPITEIAGFVKEFLEYARQHPDTGFKIWQIGTGKAGYKDADMAPLFAGAPPNCIFAASWRRIIAQVQSESSIAGPGIEGSTPVKQSGSTHQPT